jgi:hypothetical protein
MIKGIWIVRVFTRRIAMTLIEKLFQPLKRFFTIGWITHRIIPLQLEEFS